MCGSQCNGKIPNNLTYYNAGQNMQLILVSHETNSVLHSMSFIMLWG